MLRQRLCTLVVGLATLAAVTATASGQAGQKIVNGSGYPEMVTAYFSPTYFELARTDAPAHFGGMTCPTINSNYGIAYFSVGQGGQLYRTTGYRASGAGIVLVGSTGYIELPAIASRYAESTGRWWFGMWSWWRTWSWWHWWWGVNSIDPVEIYGAASRYYGFTDTLIRIDPDTGAGTDVGLFGTHAGRKIQDIQGMTFDHRTGLLFGVTGYQFDGTPGDLFTIDVLTGQATYWNSLQSISGGAPPANAVTGITFDHHGDMYCSLGYGGDPNFMGATLLVERRDLAQARFRTIRGSATGEPAEDIMITNSF